MSGKKGSSASEGGGGGKIGNANESKKSKKKRDKRGGNGGGRGAEGQGTSGSKGAGEGNKKRQGGGRSMNKAKEEESSGAGGKSGARGFPKGGGSKGGGGKGGGSKRGGSKGGKGGGGKGGGGKGSGGGGGQAPTGGARGRTKSSLGGGGGRTDLAHRSTHRRSKSGGDSGSGRQGKSFGGGRARERDEKSGQGGREIAGQGSRPPASAPITIQSGRSGAFPNSRLPTRNSMSPPFSSVSPPFSSVSAPFSSISPRHHHRTSPGRHQRISPGYDPCNPLASLKALSPEKPPAPVNRSSSSAPTHSFMSHSRQADGAKEGCKEAAELKDEVPGRRGAGDSPVLEDPGEVAVPVGSGGDSGTERKKKKKKKKKGADQWLPPAVKEEQEKEAALRAAAELQARKEKEESLQAKESGEGSAAEVEGKGSQMVEKEGSEGEVLLGNAGWKGEGAALGNVSPLRDAVEEDVPLESMNCEDDLALVAKEAASQEDAARDERDIRGDAGEKTSAGVAVASAGAGAVAMSLNDLFYPVTSSAWVVVVDADCDIEVFERAKVDEGMRIGENNVSIEPERCLGSRDLLMLEWYMDAVGVRKLLCDKLFIRHRSPPSRYRKVELGLGSWRLLPAEGYQCEYENERQVEVGLQLLKCLVLDFMLARCDKFDRQSLPAPASLMSAICRFRGTLGNDDIGGKVREWCDAVVGAFR